MPTDWLTGWSTKFKNARGALAKLPVHETVEVIPEEVKAEPDAFEKISEERSFEVEITGPKLVKREFVRP